MSILNHFYNMYKAATEKEIDAAAKDGFRGALSHASEMDLFFIFQAVQLEKLKSQVDAKYQSSAGFKATVECITESVQVDLVATQAFRKFRFDMKTHFNIPLDWRDNCDRLSTATKGIDYIQRNLQEQVASLESADVEKVLRHLQNVPKDSPVFDALFFGLLENDCINLSDCLKIHGFLEANDSERSGHLTNKIQHIVAHLGSREDVEKMITVFQKVSPKLKTFTAFVHGMLENQHVKVNDYVRIHGFLEANDSDLSGLLTKEIQRITNELDSREDIENMITVFQNVPRKSKAFDAFFNGLLQNVNTTLVQLTTLHEMLGNDDSFRSDVLKKEIAKGVSQITDEADIAGFIKWYNEFSGKLDWNSQQLADAIGTGISQNKEENIRELDDVLEIKLARKKLERERAKKEAAQKAAEGATAGSKATSVAAASAATDEPAATAAKKQAPEAAGGAVVAKTAQAVASAGATVLASAPNAAKVAETPSTAEAPAKAPTAAEASVPAQTPAKGSRNSVFNTAAGALWSGAPSNGSKAEKPLLGAAATTSARPSEAKSVAEPFAAPSTSSGLVAKATGSFKQINEGERKSISAAKGGNRPTPGRLAINPSAAVARVAVRGLGPRTGALTLKDIKQLQAVADQVQVSFKAAVAANKASDPTKQESLEVKAEINITGILAEDVKARAKLLSQIQENTKLSNEEFAKVKESHEETCFYYTSTFSAMKLWVERLKSEEAVVDDVFGAHRKTLNLEQQTKLDAEIKELTDNQSQYLTLQDSNNPAERSTKEAELQSKFPELSKIPKKRIREFAAGQLDKMIAFSTLFFYTKYCENRDKLKGLLGAEKFEVLDRELINLLNEWKQIDKRTKVLGLTFSSIAKDSSKKPSDLIQKAGTASQ